MLFGTVRLLRLGMAKQQRTKYALNSEIESPRPVFYPFSHFLV